MTTPAAEYKRAHGELMAEAAAMAAECEVDVHIIAFLPGGAGATKHTFVGAPTDATVAAEETKRNQAAAKDKAKLMAFIGKDVSKMTMEEAKTHHGKLMNLRANVIRKLQQKAAAATSIAGDGDDEDGHRNKISKIGS
uniref:MADS-box domain-containing protein n=1 Tax=Leersia perrieri TaxID=77586 RepID=A0A0D9X453_9ORYZ